MNGKQLSNELRQMADVLENLEFPEDSEAWNYGAQITFWNMSKEDLQIFIRTMGKVTKSASESSFNVTSKFGDSKVYAYAKNREEVCTKVVKEVVKEPKRAYVEIPGEFVDREIVEWECDPILGA